MEVIPRQALPSILAAPWCQMAPGTYGFVRRPVQVQCHPSHGSKALEISTQQRMYGGRHMLDDILSPLSVTKCPHEYGTVIRIGHVI